MTQEDRRLLRTARALSPVAREDLARSLDVQLTAELQLAGEEHMPPAVVEYWATFRVGWFRGDAEDGWTAQDEAALVRLATSAGVGIEEDLVLIPVGHAHLVVADFDDPGVYEALDAREGDLEYLGGVLLDDDELHADLTDSLEGFERFGVLVNTVTVAEQWRGLRLGLLGTGTALRELSRGCGFAALDAMKPGAEGDRARADAHKALARYWQRLGFTPWRERVLLLDLATRALDDALADLVRQRSRRLGSSS